MFAITQQYSQLYADCVQDGEKKQCAVTVKADHLRKVLKGGQEKSCLCCMYRTLGVAVLTDPQIKMTRSDSAPKHT